MPKQVKQPSVNGKSQRRKKHSVDVIIRQTLPAIVSAEEQPRADDRPLTAPTIPEIPVQGLAQLEEPAVRNGEDPGSKPGPLIEHPQGQLKGDPSLREGAIVAPSAAPYADGSHEVPPSAEAALPIVPPPKRRIKEIYPYTDKEGEYLYEVVRYEPKDFRPRRCTGKNRYEWTLEGVRRVPYRLHDFANRKGEMVFVLEGEKDVNAANKLGLLATCSMGGANGWKPEFAEYLHHHTVVIIPDNDEAGETYADIVATSIDNIAVDWRIVRLPKLPEKGDLSDFLEAGGTKDDILRLVTKAFEVGRPQNFALYDNAADTLGRATAKPSKPAQPIWSIRERCFADIEQEPIEWLWRGMWLNHSLNMLIGRGGLGKSYLAAHLAAAVSRGMPFPDGGGVAPLGDVVYCSTEGLLGAHMRPRLEAAGADLDRVWTWEAKETTNLKGEHVESGISLADIDLMIQRIDKRPELRLIIFDPVLAYLENAEANDNQDVRALLENIGKVCHTKKLTVLLIHHTKKGQAAAIDSAMGAQAFIAVPRSVWMLQTDPESTDKYARCLSPVKMNEAPDDQGKKFTLVFEHGLDGPGHIVWDSVPDNRTADEITNIRINKNLAAGRANTEETSTAKNEERFFEVLDALEQPAGTWVACKQVKTILNWNGSRFAKMLFDLERTERIERQEGDKIMPNGTVQKGGREEVRRKKHGPY